MRLLVPLLLFAGFTQADGFAGRVLEDHTGNPLASVGVRVYKGAETALLADLETDIEGRFRAPGLPAGDYRLELSKPNFLPATLRLHIEGDTPIVTRLVRCGAIAGRVSDAQGNAVRAEVFAMVKPPGSPVFQPLGLLNGSRCSTDERGRYRLYGLAPGQYAVAVWHAAGVAFYPNDQHPQIFSVSGGEEYPNIDFSLAPTALYSVSGSVTVPEDGSVALALTPTGQPSLAVAKLRSNRDGGFRFEGIPPGSYELFAAYPALGSGGLNTAVLSQNPQFGRTHVDVGGQNVEGLALSLSEGRSAAFLLHGQGCPRTATISLAPLEDWGSMLNRTVEINAAAATAVNHLAPGRYTVNVGSLGENCFSLTSPVLDLARPSGAATIVIELVPAASIRGKLTGLGTARPSEFPVVLIAPDSVQIAVPDAEARFTFGPLRPGKYRISAQRSRLVSDLSRMIELDLLGGSPTDLDLPVR